MTTKIPEGTQRVTPYLSYADAPAAIAFLCKAFGFEEKYRLPMPDGRIGHAELVMGPAQVFLASVWAEMGHASVKDLPGVHCQIHCLVEDVDAHYERALAAGATILSKPEDQFYGDRVYRALDSEGQRWSFAEPKRTVSVEEMQRLAAQAGSGNAE
jgi:PhnB protein